MIYRTGRRNPHAIYEQHGPVPSDDDTFVGSVRTGHMARTLVDAANPNAAVLTAVRHLIEGWDEFSVLNQADYEGLAALVNVVDERIEPLRAALGGEP